MTQLPRPKSSLDKWVLQCELCDTEWADDTTVSVMELHFSIEHPDETTVRLKTVWLGEGPAPDRTPNRQARRNAARKKRRRR